MATSLGNEVAQVGDGGNRDVAAGDNAEIGKNRDVAHGDNVETSTPTQMPQLELRIPQEFRSATAALD